VLEEDILVARGGSRWVVVVVESEHLQ